MSVRLYIKTIRSVSGICATRDAGVRWITDSHRGEKNELVVVKRRSQTGVTVGVVNSIMSVRRAAGDRPGASLEICVLGKGNEPFSDDGDSGSTIVDWTGRIVGVLTGGAGRRAPGRDVTYATPWEWLLPRVQKAVGGDLEVM